MSQLYDPMKSYKWEPDDQFVFSGIEFDKLYRIVKYKYYQNELTPAAVTEMYSLLQEKFIDSVEKGISKEIPPPTLESNQTEMPPN